jgi:C1A family cysteine protease
MKKKEISYLLKNKFAALFFILIIPVNIFCQEYSTGVDLTPELYKNAVRSAELMRGDFKELPAEYSLAKFTPDAAHQGSLSTCAGWAVSYYGRTMLEAIKYNWENEFVTLNTFSPSFVYNKIRVDSGCSKGVSLLEAVQVLKDYGSVKMSFFPYDCSRNISGAELQMASQYKIKDFRVICTREDKDKTRIVKKSIIEKNPVIIAIDCPESFYTAGEFWSPAAEELTFRGRGHALTVAGYNDTINGGSFYILNSWGNEWGKEGSTWIRYSDFEKITYYAFDLIDIPDDLRYELSGSLNFLDESGKSMSADYNGNCFVMKKSYSSGTKFQLYLNNNNSAYVYAFSTDLKQNVYKIFPPHKKISPLLPYKKNNIAIPDEYHYNMLDEVKGKSYYVFIYSKNEVDIDKLLSDAESERRPVYDLLERYFGEQSVKGNMFSGGDTIKFQSGKESKTIFLVVEFNHK